MTWNSRAPHKAEKAKPMMLETADASRTMAIGITMLPFPCSASTAPSTISRLAMRAPATRVFIAGALATRPLVTTCFIFAPVRVPVVQGVRPAAARRTLGLWSVSVFAGDVRVHVGEGAARVALPRPDMQLVERPEAGAGGRAHEVEQLALQLGGPLGGDVLHRDQRHLAVGAGLVHDRLRMGDVDGVGPQELLAHIV